MTAKDRYIASNDWRGPYVQVERPDYEWDGDSRGRSLDSGESDSAASVGPRRASGLPCESFSIALRRFLGNALSGTH